LNKEDNVHSDIQRTIQSKHRCNQKRIPNCQIKIGVTFYKLIKVYLHLGKLQGRLRIAQPKNRTTYKIYRSQSECILLTQQREENGLQIIDVPNVPKPQMLLIQKHNSLWLLN